MFTSDDELALKIAQHHDGVSVLAPEGGGLELSVEEGALDPYALALGSAGVAIRRLELLASPVESMFFVLTAEPGLEAAGSAEEAEPAREKVADA
jgi:hypothetical protein